MTDSIFEAERALERNLWNDITAAINALPTKTAETMAKATFEVLKKAAVSIGQRESEVSIRKPGEPRWFSDITCWAVAWEAGPANWAIPASLLIGEKCGKLVEPYYSFDLCFYPQED